MIRSDTALYLRSTTGNQPYVNCVKGGAVTLFYNDAEKFATSNTGATVTGTLVVNPDADSSLSVVNAGTNAIGIYAASGDELYLGSNGGSAMRIHSGGAVEATASDFRAPLFYDSADTSQYIDPANTSTSIHTKAKWVCAGGHGTARMHITYVHGDGTNDGALTGWVSEPGITYNGAGIGGNINVSGQYYGRYQNSGYGSYVRFDKSNGAIEGWTTTGTAGTAGGQGTKRWHSDNSGNFYGVASLRAPILYDSDQTSYYCNPSSTSVLNGATFASAITLASHLRTAAGGNASDPLITPSNDTNTGIYFPGSGVTGVGGTGGLVVENDVFAFSDRKLKKNIKTLDGSKVYDMRGVSFTRKDTNREGSGIIAQELQKIAPELIDDVNGTLSVAYGNITGYLIEAIKDLKAEIEELKNHKCDGCTK